MCENLDVDRKEELLVFISSKYIANLATININIPHLAIIFYVSDGVNLYFKSRKSSNHSNNLEKNKKASISIYCEKSDYNSKYGVQLIGSVNQISDELLMGKVINRYGEAFEGSKLKLPSIKKLCSKEVKSTFYQFSINKFKIVDENFEKSRTMLEYLNY